jgi:hypothetical protein
VPPLGTVAFTSVVATQKYNINGLFIRPWSHVRVYSFPLCISSRGNLHVGVTRGNCWELTSPVHSLSDCCLFVPVRKKMHGMR